VWVPPAETWLNVPAGGAAVAGVGSSVRDDATCPSTTVAVCPPLAWRPRHFVRSPLNVPMAAFIFRFARAACTSQRVAPRANNRSTAREGIALHLLLLAARRTRHHRREPLRLTLQPHEP
jgi:hypothetical protein